jgi:hypothetical protein
VQTWKDVGVVERYLHQPWDVVAAMPWTTFRRHLYVAVYWARKEEEAVQAARER